MTKFFKTTQKTGIQRLDGYEKGCWIDLVNPSDDEVEDICMATGIPDEMIKAPLDEEERARMETDDGCTLFILDTPILVESDGEDSYSTIPMGIIYNDQCIVTISLRGNPVLRDFMSKRNKISTDRPVGFILSFMLENMKRFLFSLRQIDKKSNRIKEELHKSMKNEDLMRLLELQNSLVYFSTSLSSNLSVQSKAERMPTVRANEDYRDLFDDVMIETRQAIETCTVYRDILTVTMEAFSSIISNSANNVMRLLTIITVVIAIPTLVAGLWGMNMPVPFEGTGTWAFWLVMGVSFVLAGIATIVMVRYTSGTKIEHEKKKKQKHSRKK
ncbi:MAG: magnesium transporter CorA family protein [Clostridia bacterium]|nr:magnesium transporter CorA family protein [Clostridia bacterium]